MAHWNDDLDQVHLLAREQAGNADAVDATDERLIHPGLDAVGEAQFVQATIHLDQFVADPRFFAARRRLGSIRRGRPVASVWPARLGSLFPAADEVEDVVIVPGLPERFFEGVVLEKARDLGILKLSKREGGTG